MPSLRKSRGLQGARLRKRSGSAYAPGPFTGDVVVTVLDGAGVAPIDGASTLVCPEGVAGPDTGVTGVVRLSLSAGDHTIKASKLGVGNGSANVTVISNAQAVVDVLLNQPFGALSCA